MADLAGRAKGFVAVTAVACAVAACGTPAQQQAGVAPDGPGTVATVVSPHAPGYLRAAVELAGPAADLPAAPGPGPALLDADGGPEIAPAGDVGALLEEPSTGTRAPRIVLDDGRPDLATALSTTALAEKFPDALAAAGDAVDEPAAPGDASSAAVLR